MPIINDQTIRIIQTLCNNYDYNTTLLDFLKKYNKSLPEPYLATGQSCYYNAQIERHGLTGLHFDKETIDDINYIRKAFRKEPVAARGEIPVVYTTLLGTTEFYYATQSFPAFIFEETFQCSVDHTLDIKPKVGEKEQDYFLRLMEYRISKSKDFNIAATEECLRRAKRIIDKFCGAKNRIYLIKIKDVLDKKYTFGDFSGYRHRKISGKEVMERLKSDVFKTLGEDLRQRYTYTPGAIDINYLYIDANFTGEFGVAIYGDLSKCPVGYIEIERMYDIAQSTARALGYQEGEEIDVNPYIMANADFKEASNEQLHNLLIGFTYGKINVSEVTTVLKAMTPAPDKSSYYDMFGRGKH